MLTQLNKVAKLNDTCFCFEKMDSFVLFIVFQLASLAPAPAGTIA